MTVRASVKVTNTGADGELHQDGNHIPLTNGASHSFTIDQSGDTYSVSLEAPDNSAAVSADVEVTAQDLYIIFWFDGDRTTLAPNEVQTFSISESGKVTFRIEKGKAPKP